MEFVPQIQHTFGAEQKLEERRKPEKGVRDVPPQRRTEGFVPQRRLSLGEVPRPEQMDCGSSQHVDSHCKGCFHRFVSFLVARLYFWHRASPLCLCGRLDPCARAYRTRLGLSF